MKKKNKQQQQQHYNNIITISKLSAADVPAPFTALPLSVVVIIIIMQLEVSV